ncbi:MAG: carbohydrate ABC transporter permease [Anaerocolumna sp.]
MKNEKKLDIVSTIILSIGLVIIILPMYFTVITAFKTQKETARNFFTLPERLFLGNFKEVISDNSFFTYVGNSVFITAVSILLVVMIVPLTSYAITRNRHKGYYKALFTMFSLGIFIPFQVIMLPVVKLMTSLSALNKFGLIVLYVTFALSQGVFLYVGYIKNNIPEELEESAYIDGCSKLQTYLRIVFPLLKPMTATVIIIDSLWIWNDFLLPLLILNRSSSYWTLPLFQYNFQSQYAIQYNLAFASFVLTIIPMLIIYLIFQKSILSGLTNGAVKG